MPSKHTPAPWSLRKSGDGKAIWIDNQGDGWHRMSCEVDSDDCDYDTAMANALLIAAAPDLLAACKLAKQRFDQLGMDWLGPGTDPIEAAINKAEPTK